MGVIQSAARDLLLPRIEGLRNSRSLVAALLGMKPGDFQQRARQSGSAPFALDPKPSGSGAIAGLRDAPVV